MDRRLRACELFLRWIADGRISAFALTEPSAGSDTARVATRARLQSVPVERDPDGVLWFVPAGGKERRNLLDAGRLVFGPGGPAYRWSDDAEPSPLRDDEYDYETDDPASQRYYRHGERKVQFIAWKRAHGADPAMVAPSQTDLREPQAEQYASS